MIHVKHVHLRDQAIDNLFIACDLRLEKAERKGWKLIDIRAYIYPESEGESKIYMVFQKYITKI